MFGVSQSLFCKRKEESLSLMHKKRGGRFSKLDFSGLRGGEGMEQEMGTRGPGHAREGGGGGVPGFGCTF